MRNIIVTGSLAFDLIMDFPGKFADNILPEKIHEINLSFLVEKLIRNRGGTAGNIAYNLALLGEKPILLAAAGNDFSDYQKSLDDVGVNTSMIYIIEAEPTASAFIFTDTADNQITGFYPGAMRFSDKLSVHDVIPAKAGIQNQHRHAEFIRRSSAEARLSASDLNKIRILNQVQNDEGKSFVVISPNDPAAMMKFVRECQKLRIDYMFDPGMQLPRLSDADLKLGIEGAKIVIGNDYEMALIHARFRGSIDQTRSQIWITTLGAKGCEINGMKVSPAQPKAVVDPTGAGDAFRAGFLSGYLSGQDLETCGKMGNLAAVYTVEKYGTQTHKYTKKEFEERYTQNYEL